jgi:quaternary ammonium compound-resistance protein SugE
MKWLILITAGLFEIVWAIGIKHMRSSEYNRNVFIVLLVFTSLILSFCLLSYTLKFLHVGTAYAIWTGIGAAGVAIAGVYFFNEPLSVLRVTFIGIIIIGIIGLHITS